MLYSLYLSRAVAVLSSTRRYIMRKRNLLKLLTAGMVVCATLAFAAGNTPVKGNKTSKIYHKQACKHYASKGSTEAFESEAGAQKAGYKICKQCAKTPTTPKTKK
jgi:hypothetical protein